MSKVTDLFDYMRQCPEVTDLWGFASEGEIGTQLIFSRGSSPIYSMQNEQIDVIGNYSGTAVPYPSIFEDFQMNMYKPYDPRDNSYGEDNVNVLSYQECENVCNWLLEQNNKRNLPKINGLKVITIEPTGTTPTFWNRPEEEPIAVYAITVRLRYVNPNKRIGVEYECED